MYYASRESKKRIVHYKHCRYSKRINRRNSIYFLTLDDARAAGYTLCDCCAPISKYVRAEREEIQYFSQEYGLMCFQHDGALEVITPRSKWKIIVNGQKHNLFLYHKNTPGTYTESMIKGYHSQCVRHSNILGYLYYIVEHDKFRKKHPFKVKPQKSPPRKGTKRWYKEERRKKEQQRRRDIAKVYQLLDELGYEEMMSGIFESAL